MESKKEKNVILEQLLRLKSPPKGRRFFSWLLFSGAIILCLVIPLLASINTDNQKQPATVQQKYNQKLLQVTADIDHWNVNRKANPTHLKLDQIWSPSKPLQSAHQPWSKDCKACHTAAFTNVKNEDCKTCHKNAGDHINKHQFKSTTTKEVECTSCHKEHQGEDGLTKQNKHFVGKGCVACHANIKSTFKEAKVENVEDFAKKHPDFQYQIQSQESKVLKTIRMSPNLKIKEKNALKFPHDVHLDTKGIKSPKGKVTMKCADCHLAKSDGLGFEPTTMKDHCQSCHDLRFEPAVSNREVPHGSVDQVLSTLREFYSYAQSAKVPVDSKPSAIGIQILKLGATQSAPLNFISSEGNAHNKASRAAVSLFEQTTCKTCHIVNRSSKSGRAGTSGQDLPQWEIEKIEPKHPWLKSQTFNHNKHKIGDCKDCHLATQSKKSEDVLMPSIAVCRDCHAGQKHEFNKITSDCGLCHGFHKKPSLKTDSTAIPSEVSYSHE